MHRAIAILVVLSAASMPACADDADTKRFNKLVRDMNVHLCARNIVKHAVLQMGKEIGVRPQEVISQMNVNPQGMRKRYDEAFTKAGEKVAIVIDGFMVTPDENEGEILDLCRNLYDS